jgi:WXG100 family type VII secretion target
MVASGGSGFIHVQFPVLEQGADDLMAGHSALTQELQSLEVDLKKMLIWNSNAHDNFEAAKREWQRLANDMATSLQGFGQFIMSTKDHYLQTEANNGSIWSN